MIEKIKKVIELQNELREKYSFISIDSGFFGSNVHVDDLDSFLGLSDKEILYSERGDREIPHRLSFVEDDIEFFIILDDEEYEEYKKATAGTVTKEIDSL